MAIPSTEHTISFLSSQFNYLHLYVFRDGFFSAWHVTFSREWKFLRYLNIKRCLQGGGGKFFSGVRMDGLSYIL